MKILKHILIVILLGALGFITYHYSNNPKAVDTVAAASFRDLTASEQYTWLEEKAEADGPETAWAYLQAAYVTPEGIIGNPHDLAHFAGKLLYKSYGFKGLSFCNPTFAFGCYHGLMQAAFDPDMPDKFPQALADAKEGCAIGLATSSPSYWSCIHGIGHGVATFRNYDMTPALKDCDTLGKNVSTYCHDGVFMEFSRNAPEAFYKASDPLYPCDAIDTSYRVGCARNQVQVLKQRFGFADVQVAKACLKSADRDITFHCIDAVGYGVTQSSDGDPREIVSTCNMIGDTAAAAQCLAAAAGELVFQNTVNWQTSAEAVCDSLTGSDHDLCEKRVEEVKTSYGRK